MRDENTGTGGEKAPQSEFLMEPENTGQDSRTGERQYAGYLEYKL